MLLLHGLILVLQQPVQRLAGDVLKLAVEQLLTFGEVGEDFGVLLQRPLLELAQEIWMFPHLPQVGQLPRGSMNMMVTLALHRAVALRVLAKHRA